MISSRNDVDPDVLNIITGHFDVGPTYASVRNNGSSSWLLIHTLAGLGRFGGATEWVTKPGEWVLIRPRYYQDYRTEGERWELLWCHFHPRPHWLPWLRWKEFSPGLMVENPIEQSEIVSTFQECLRLSAQTNIHADSLAMNALENVILRIDQARQSVHQSLDPRIEAAVDYVLNHFGDLFSLADLARNVGLSESRFSHLFRREMGVAPREFIERMRLERAAGLLRLTDHSIQDIAMQVGFENPFYFTLRFKRHTGKSPTDFRREVLPIRE